MQFVAATPENRSKEARKTNSGVLLLHDNTPAHTSQVAMTAVTECGFEIILHPQYSPDMAPCDFYLFPKLKSHLRGTPTVWMPRRRHRGHKRVLGELGIAFFFKGIRKLEQRWVTNVSVLS